MRKNILILSSMLYLSLVALMWPLTAQSQDAAVPKTDSEILLPDSYDYEWGTPVAVPPTPSATALRIANKYGCPVNYSSLRKDYQTENPIITLRVRFTTELPNRALSDIYERLAFCAPNALKLLAVETDISGIFTFARNNKLVPLKADETLYKSFERAVKRLTTETIGTGTARDGKWVLPKLDVKMDEGFRVIDVPTSTYEPEWAPKGLKVAREPTQEDLSRACQFSGLSSDCAQLTNVVANEFRIRVAGEDRKISTRFKVFIPLTTYELAIPVPEAASSAIGQDLLRTILPGVSSGADAVSTSGLLLNDLRRASFDAQRPDGTFLPKGALNSQVSTGDRKKPWWIKQQWQRIKLLTGLIDSSRANRKTTVLVGEPYFPSGVTKLAELKHDLANQNTVIDLPMPIFDPPGENESDPGHAFHVSHSIGAKGSVAGWTGFGGGVGVRVASLPAFKESLSTMAKDSKISHQNRLDYNPPYQVVNMSFMITKCLDPSFRTRPTAEELGDWFDIHNNLKNLRNNRTATFSVISASQYRSGCLYNEYYPIIIEDANCTGLLSCIGRERNAISVAAIKTEQDALLDGTRWFNPDVKAKLLGAPGEYILGADVKDGENGYSLRSGSSHAAAIVSSLAARLMDKYTLLRENHRVKPHLVATATQPKNADMAKAIYGTVNFHRALNSDPDDITVWQSDGGDGEILLTGKDLRFLGVDDQLQGVPMDTGHSRGHRLEPASGGTVPFYKLHGIVASNLPGGGKRMFRNIYRNADDRDRLFIGPPYDLEQDKGGDGRVCSLAETRPDASPPPCLYLDNTPIPMSRVSHIVMRAQ